MTERVNDLAADLTQFLNELIQADVRFAWGQWDCNTFVLAWLDRVTGGSQLSQYQGRYDSEESARAFARGLNRNLLGVCLSNGMKWVPGGAAFAQPGDVILAIDEDEPWYRGHVCAGSRAVSVFPGAGLGSVPMSEMPPGTIAMRCS